MARTYRRDARGRFAGGGFSGQSGGRGARLKASGTRQGGGAKMTAARVGGTVAKPRGLKPQAVKANRQNRSIASPEQRRMQRALANVNRAKAAKPAAGSRRLSKSQIRSQLRTEGALEMYRGGESAAKSVRNARGLARTERARNNWMQTRSDRLAQAQRSGDPMATVGKKPRASRQPKTGRDIQMAQIRKVQNQKLRDLNRRIKEAGPSAGGLRLEKLKLQDAMRATAPRR